MTHYKGNQQPVVTQQMQQGAPKINQGGAKEQGGSQEGQEGGEQQVGKDAEEEATKIKSKQQS